MSSDSGQHVQHLTCQTLCFVCFAHHLSQAGRFMQRCTTCYYFVPFWLDWLCGVRVRECLRERERGEGVVQCILVMFVSFLFSVGKLTCKFVKSWLLPLWQRVKACLHCPHWNEFYTVNCLRCGEWRKIVWQVCWPWCIQVSAVERESV